MNTNRFGNWPAAFLALGLGSAALAGCAENSPSPQVGDGPAKTTQDQGNPGNSTNTQPSVNADLRDRVIALTSGFEHIPSKSEFDALGPADKLEEALLALVDDPAIKLNQRTHMLSALRFYPSPKTRARLELALTDPAQHANLRRAAVPAYGEAFGKDEAGTALLAKMAEHPDMATRTLAIKALKSVGTPDAQKAIDARIAVETEPSVKAAAK